VSLSGEETTVFQKMMDILTGAGLSGSTLKTMAEDLHVTDQVMKRVFQYMLDENLAVRLPGGLILHSDALSRAREILMDRIRIDGSITVASFRDAAGISRKQSVPLLEYFDAIGLTRRRGDERVLRESP
ncbi:MAG TPA: SelB C-terminal domain-containing protein, partial [bacterium]|nr:SelB C-terminal domain-containing protein [bacterium]